MASVAAGALSVLLAVIVGGAAAQEPPNCASQFSPQGESVGNIVIVPGDAVSELAAVGTLVLPTITWMQDGVFNDPYFVSNLDTAIGKEYLNYAFNVAERSITVTVNKSMEGLADYSDQPPVAKLTLIYKFPLVEVQGIYSDCELRMEVPLADENTASPTTDKQTYDTTVREDYPEQLVIPELQVMASDNDSTSPNNLLQVTFSEQSCPLVASPSSIDASGGDPVLVQFVLKQKLDYDHDPETVKTCTGSLQDQGNPSKSDTFTITVTVEPYNDEPPIFERQLYKAELSVPQAGPDPIVTLTATDGDLPPQVITYSMDIISDEDPSWTAYFRMDPASGSVYQDEDLPEDMLAEYSVHFLATATDDSGITGTTVLEIVLPQPTTTTTSTTTTQTTTVPTTTTSTTTTTTTTPPVTTTPEATTSTTCPPCPTEATTATWWTTSSSTSVPNTTTTSTPTTTTTADAATTDETTTCPPCTTAVVTACPTQETTTEGSSTTDTSSSTPLQITTTDLTTSQITTTTTHTTDAATTCEPCICSTSTSDTTDSTTVSATPTTTASTAALTTVSTLTSTTTSTPCPTVCPTPTTTDFPPPLQYKFELQSYHFQPYTTTVTVGNVKVVAQEGQTEPETVTYAWDPQSSNGTEYFSLNEATGFITINVATPPSPDTSYVLVATAEADGNHLETTVYIIVQSTSSGETLFLPAGVIDVSVSEADPVGTVLANLLTEGVKSYCFAATPTQYHDYFKIEPDGILTLTTQIDADEMPTDGRLIRLRVVARENEGDCVPVPPTGDLGRNEALVLVSIQDVNDQPPYIEYPPESFRVGQPTNKGLQQVVGQLLTVQVRDNDTAGNLTTNLSGSSSNLFFYDDSTGDLFLVDPDGCGASCNVTITVSDGLNEAQETDVEVYSLDMSYIYDVTLDAMTTDEIKTYIAELSTKTDLDLQLLYATFELQQSSKQDSPARGLKSPLPYAREHRGGRNVGARSTARATPSISCKAHIYGFDEKGSLVTQEVLNGKLSDAEEESVSEFSEKSTFDPSSPSTVGYQVAVGVLGALVGVLLVLAVVAYVLFRKKKTHKKTSEQPVGVSTIGSAYPDHHYDATEMTPRLSDSSGEGDINSNKKKPSKASYVNGAVKHVDRNPSYESPAYDNLAYKTPHDVISPVQTTGYEGAAEDGDVYAEPYAAGLPPRRGSQHSLGLRRIDPGPSPAGTKSSPYLTGLEGDYTASRHTDSEMVASFRPYKGEESNDGGVDSIKMSAVYTPVYDNSGYGSSPPTSRGHKENNKTKNDSKQVKIDEPQYAVPVRTKKEPPNLSSAAPVKPIMKHKEATTVRTHAEVHAEDGTAENIKPHSSNSSNFSKLKSSPPLKKKNKDVVSSDQEEKKSNLKNNVSDSETTDSEVKKSVAFKVLVDQKEIKRREEEEEEETEKL